MDLKFKQRNCEFDSCRTGACSSLEQAADECKKEGFCIDWRELTNGSCSMYTLSKFSLFSFIYLCTVTVFDSKLISVSVHVSGVTCPKGLVYDECREKMDDFCYGGFVTFTDSIFTLIIEPRMFLLEFFLFLSFHFFVQSALYRSLPGETQYRLFLSQWPVQSSKSLTHLCIRVPMWVQVTQ